LTPPLELGLRLRIILVVEYGYHSTSLSGLLQMPNARHELLPEAGAERTL
jgi:hypothetical protein